MRPPIFVRELTPDEREHLRVGLRSPEALVLRRCQILLARATGEHAPQIAVACDTKSSSPSRTEAGEDR